MRLTETGQKENRISLKVEGWISGDSSALLETECDERLARGCALELDLSRVSYVDAHGAETLRRLRRRTVEIVGCPQFILEFVNGDASFGKGGQI